MLNPNSAHSRLPVTSQALLGAIAGGAATVVMTATMNRLHRHLPSDERYPLPPREITERIFPDVSDHTIKDSATAAHHGYGAVAGALIATTLPRLGLAGGAVAGVGIWAASYFGWVPATSTLRPAHQHPWRRNVLMIAAHVVWGVVTAASIRELDAARSATLRSGPIADAPIRRGERGNTA